MHIRERIFVSRKLYATLSPGNKTRLIGDLDTVIEWPSLIGFSGSNAPSAVMGEVQYFISPLNVIREIVLDF